MKKKLNQLAATAICGNDISSSCLYVSALAIVYAGQYAWISLLIVSIILYLFRKIYGEVVGALPLNGGAYNALLNTTKKSTASFAASLTILSYMATAVISASEAVKYAHSLWSSVPVLITTILLLFIFMGLVIKGIGESSKVAVVIFLFHLSSLVILCFFSIYFLFYNGFEILTENFKAPVEGGIMKALFFGFAAAMLGISGFESSANYVEEQQKGVFPKTLKNMWIIVTVFNPLLAFLALSIIPLATIETNEETLLSFMGNLTGGNWLFYLVSIDAVLVLSGAVLTSYIGVGGLVERMALDRILPNILLKKNKKGSSYLIFIAFFLLSVSILVITEGDLEALAGVYTIAFLGVMILFGIGNMLLKINRSKLPRPESTGWIALIVAILGIIIALIGNVILNPEYLTIFLRYLFPTILVVGFMLYRTPILKGVLLFLDYLTPSNKSIFKTTKRKINVAIRKINAQEFVFFTKRDDVATLNKVLQYITDNEETRKLKIVTLLKENQKTPSNLKKDIEVLDRAYPDIVIEFIEEEGKFGPEKIKELSKRWNIPVNFMFIGSPGDKFPYKLQELGEVRLII
ncbi:amino acid/polyamine/organocation transporter (APC superfamily) [Tenacibaculum adriaticum]|uniref:Amino acid/polyamine/organocation transporter (APC superfamily) n=1 Tax=Tenacibaculum adriaticum TaxID=413713 RepID=A0A5S5DSR9_9FLAO|nr:APC family permease [Tenacibaculum adriaticum]TYP98973.1 amino acid/polyamine/organocation transporter (APC superfamily) [Tenacibaculum adriaticum]